MHLKRQCHSRSCLFNCEKRKNRDRDNYLINCVALGFGSFVASL